MGISWKCWFGAFQKKLLRASSPRRETVIVLHTNNTVASSSFTEEPTTREEEKELEEADDVVVVDRYSTNIDALSAPSTDQRQENDMLILSIEDIAATKIQAYFRSHLARRAYRALRSLVKLQAVVRGVLVRRQAHLALDCMHSLARLQVTVRARQLLDKYPID